MSYQFYLTCPRCGADVRHEASGTTNGYATQAIVACTGCRDRWIIRVTATSCRMTRRAENETAGRPPNCGSVQGRMDHLRAGEEPCDACKVAHAANQRRPVGVS